jgi:hypothetical protein
MRIALCNSWRCFGVASIGIIASMTGDRYRFRWASKCTFVPTLECVGADYCLQVYSGVNDQEQCCLETATLGLDQDDHQLTRLQEKHPRHPRKELSKSSGSCDVFESARRGRGPQERIMTTTSMLYDKVWLIHFCVNATMTAQSLIVSRTSKLFGN